MPTAATATASKARDAQLNRANLGFLLAKASQRWNELLYERFVASGYAEVRPAYGSILIPLFEEDGLRMGELGRRAGLAKQTMTTMVRLLERDGLVERRGDPHDGRAKRVFLTERARGFRPVAEGIVGDLDALVGERVKPSDRAAARRALEEVIRL
jgi:DNA-binding MarR family transcriptional regulator